MDTQRNLTVDVSVDISTVNGLVWLAPVMLDDSFEWLEQRRRGLPVSAELEEPSLQCCAAFLGSE